MVNADRSGLAGFRNVVQFLFAAAAKLAVEGEMHHAVGVESRQQYADQQQDEHQQAD